MPLEIKTVLISESVDPGCAKILAENGVKVTTKVGMSKEELMQEIQNYDGLVVRSATKVTADVIASGKALKIIGRAGVGVDNIDCDAATKHGVLVINAPGGNTLSAAELTCGMIVSLSRNITEACASLKGGKWDRKSFMANELLGKTLAIIGLGRIGREVASRMQAFGMKTIGFDPLVPGEESIKFGVTSYSLDEIWPQADYITVHTPLIKQTKNLINKDVLAKCRKGVKIVNCARGGIVSEDDLVEALESGQCSGAGFDVFLEEPPKNTRFIQHPKVICTPHLGASTKEAQSRVAIEISEQFADLISGKPAHGIVNSPAFSLSMAEANQPWVNLGKAVGAVVAALVKSDHISLNIEVNGSDLNRKESLFSTAILIGMLGQHNIAANFINAPTLAQGRGIEVSSVKLFDGDAAISVIAKISSGFHLVKATLRGNDPVLYSIDNLCFNAPVSISNNLILARGNCSTENIMKLIGTFNEKQALNGIAFSVPENTQIWSAIYTNIKCSTVPDNLSSQFTYWAQINL